MAGFLFLIWMAGPHSADIEVPVAFNPDDIAEIKKGERLAAAAGCKACHTVEGQPSYTGGRRLETPYGIFVSPNITSLRDWTPAEFVQALRYGLGRNGEALYPSFPYASYAKMTNEDALSLYAYFRSFAPVMTETADHELPLPFKWRGLMNGWRLLFWADEPLNPAERGRYLVEALGHCGECHTPRTPFGNLDRSRHLQGKPPIDALGLDDWDLAEVSEFLLTGQKPDFDTVEGEMAEVIAESTSQLSAADRLAIAQYLKTPVKAIASHSQKH